MIKRIIFVVEMPFTQRDYRRFGFDVLKRNGFKVEAWDITSVLYPEASRKIKLPDELFSEQRIIFSTKKDLYSQIRHLSGEDFVIGILGYNIHTWDIYRRLSRSAASVGRIRNKSTVFHTVDQSYLRKKQPIGLWLKKLTIEKILQKIFKKTPFFLLGIRPINLLMLGGEKETTFGLLVGSRTEKLWIHSADYDVYLQDPLRQAVKEEPIAVFIDENEGFHPEYALFKTKNVVAPDRYYPSLNKFFDKVEKDLALRVVIAAHPKSCYEDHPGIFAGRSWVRGQTYELIKKAKVVFTHASTSISWACLFKKPIVFLTCEGFDSYHMGWRVQMNARFFNKTPVYIDRDLSVDWAKEKVVNDDVYKQYKKFFIKTDRSADILFWQVVADRLKNWK